jgi:hypothetical protein
MPLSRNVAIRLTAVPKVIPLLETTVTVRPRRCQNDKSTSAHALISVAN